jgi:predicted dehydrogenase
MSAREAPFGIGVVGLGLMGRTHLKAWQAAGNDGLPCRVVAVADRNAGRLTGADPGGGNLRIWRKRRLFDPRRVRATTDPHELLADPAVQIVSICTHTDSHVELASAALRAGKHVLVEKPVDMHAGAVRALDRLAQRVGRRCMPAMCMRFWPGWDWLHARIVDGSFGRVKSATFQRLGSTPTWGRKFYGDFARSGGALLDLHIHDVDFVCWCFGMPRGVRATGSLEHVTACYRFADGPDHVIAEGAWDLAPAAGFGMRYLVNFERATADFDQARKHALVLHQARRSRPVKLPPGLGYDGEVRHLLDVVRGRTRDLRATLSEAADVLDLLARERRQL